MAVVTIASSRLYSYRLPLSRTLHLRGDSFLEREGLVLCLESESGHGGWGEIAPLPGFSRESLDESAEQAGRLMAYFSGRAVPQELRAAGVLLQSFNQEILPSVRCGFEAALMHLAAEQTESAVVFVDEFADYRSVVMNGLLDGDEGEILRQTELLINQGYRAVKLKVGRQSLDQDIALVYRVHARLRGRATLRLDANRAWAFAEAVEFGKAVDILKVEYVEEPLKESLRLSELGRVWGCPIALDETLIEADARQFEPFPGLRALVLKPMLFGGFLRALEWVEWAKKFAVVPVVSSLFETDLGLTMLGHFAAQVAPGIPCGLSTSDRFTENLLQRPLEISGGAMILDDHRTLSLDVRNDRLTEVARA